MSETAESPTPSSQSAQHSAAHGKFIWCELMTSDTAAAGAFYASVVGWGLHEMSMPGLPPYVLFQLGEGDNCPGIAGMMDFPPELRGQLPPNWTGYVAVDDVDATARRFVELGGRVQRQPDDIAGVGRFAVVADPQGAVLCIMTPIPPDNPPPQPAAGTPGTVGWHELYAGDGATAFDFYAGVFGWTQHHQFDMGPMGAYRIFAHANERPGEVSGGIMTKPPSVPFPCWAYYFAVEAIDAAIGRIEAAGGTVVNGPVEVPGDTWIVQATDPQGAFFALMAPKR